MSGADEDRDLAVGKPERAAAGPAAVAWALRYAVGEMGPLRAARALARVNQADGFDCPGCAWPEPERRGRAELCENGAKAVAEEATRRRADAAFFARHSVAELTSWSDFELGRSGRLTEPMLLDAGATHYAPIAWEEAFAIVADELRALGSPDEAVFYTSGRTANETAFAYQLFVRAFGTNNLPDCSNMCHESTGLAMGETIGVGKSAISYEDFAKSDLIIIMGQNPGTCHPRMLTALEEAKLAGAQIAAVNPLPEAGLINFRNPQKPRGLVGKGTDLADQFLQIRLAGDMALMQALAKRVLAAEDAAPGAVLDHAFLEESCQGLEEYRAHIANLDDAEVLAATGLRTTEIDELADRYLKADKVIVTWAMGLTQHKKAVPTIKEIVNLL